MAGFLPRPLPDELLFSVFARFHARAGYTQTKSTAMDLFGHDVRMGFFPSHLQDLLEHLPLGHRLSVHDLVLQHTFAPLFLPFLGKARRERLFEAIATGTTPGNLKSVTSLLGSWAPDHAGGLRLCPLCVADDRSQFGEAYWHRVHQFPGVEVCPHHKVFLISSGVTIVTQGSRGLVALEELQLVDRAGTPLNRSDPVHRALLSVAQELGYLLDNRVLPESDSQVRESYSFFLGQKGLVKPSGVDVDGFIHLFQEFWPPEILARNNHSYSHTTRKNAWMLRVARSTHGVVVDPLGHVLVALALGHTIMDLFQPLGLPFGAGPWPCLNRICPSYLLPVIATCSVAGSPGGIQRGQFRCECGFHYERVGPDPNGMSETVPYRVLNLGDIWRAKIEELFSWNEAEVQKAMRMLAKKPALTDQLQQGLPHIRLRLNHKTSGRTPKDPESFREDRRSTWLRLLVENPDLGRDRLKALAPNVYTWLFRRDRAWLEAHAPQKAPFRGPRYDWTDRGANMAQWVEEIAASTLNQPGRPVRLSRNYIFRELSRRYRVTVPRNRHLAELSAALEKHAESTGDFQIRLLTWLVASVETPLARGQAIRRFMRSVKPKHRPSLDHLARKFLENIEVALDWE